MRRSATSSALKVGPGERPTGARTPELEARRYARWQLKHNVRPPNRLEFERQYSTTFSDTAAPHESQMSPETNFVSEWLGADGAFGWVRPPLDSDPVALFEALRPKRAPQSTVCATCRAARARAIRSTVAAATIDVTRVASAAPMSFGSNDLLMVAYSCSDLMTVSRPSTRDALRPGGRETRPALETSTTGLMVKTSGKPSRLGTATRPLEKNVFQYRNVLPILFDRRRNTLSSTAPVS
jgi:hypothetical protein